MLGTRRLTEETWVEHIQRATHLAEDMMQSLGYECWVTEHRRRKWRLAGRVSQSNDGRWSKRLLGWQPFFRCVPRRNVGHPYRRWEDSIVDVAGGDWVNVTLDADLWAMLEPAYVQRI